MTEADLKRALLKSLTAQEGEGFRIEDKYRLGVPDCLMLPVNLPGFMIEAKIVRGTKLICTAAQEMFLSKWHKPPRFLSGIIGYADKFGALYIGHNGATLADCRYVPRPTRLESSEWPITELLSKWYFDEMRARAEKKLDMIS